MPSASEPDWFWVLLIAAAVRLIRRITSRRGGASVSGNVAPVTRGDTVSDVALGSVGPPPFAPVEVAEELLRTAGIAFVVVAVMRGLRVTGSIRFADGAGEVHLDDGTAVLRFGDGERGRRPAAGTGVARNRSGSGRLGRVAAGGIGNRVKRGSGVPARVRLWCTTRFGSAD